MLPELVSHQLSHPDRFAGYAYEKLIHAVATAPNAIRAFIKLFMNIIKKLKKGGYTLEAVLDDALTYYFENSEDGKEALKKAEIFYS